MIHKELPCRRSINEVPKDHQLSVPVRKVTEDVRVPDNLPVLLEEVLELESRSCIGNQDFQRRIEKLQFVQYSEYELQKDVENGLLCPVA